MRRPDASSGRTGRPPVTSRAEILGAARRVIDRDGWEKLTIRRLATELGIGPTTVYHHVRDREDLLIALINDHLDQTVELDLPDAPRERIVASAVAVRDALAAWPWAAEVLTTDGFIPRLGDRSLGVVETILDAAMACGCTPDRAVDLFRHLWYYTAGELLVRAHSRDRPPPPRPFFASLDETRMPRLAAIGDRWPQLAARDTYREGVEALVDGLLAAATPARPR